MKKLYRKGTVHPSPPTISDQLLSFLPATILTLTVALSPEDREVLAYLISCSSSSSSSSSSSNGNNSRRTTTKGVVVVDGDHPPLFHCSCFRCYMSYWVRWDSSPNHQLIHEIIDTFEESLAQTSNKKYKRNKKGSNNKSPKLKRSEFTPSAESESGVVSSSSSISSSISNNTSSAVDVGEGGGGDVGDEEKGSVRRFVSFIGERIWGVWGQ